MVRRNFFWVDTSYDYNSIDRLLLNNEKIDMIVVEREISDSEYYASIPLISSQSFFSAFNKGDKIFITAENEFLEDYFRHKGMVLYEDIIPLSKICMTGQHPSQVFFEISGVCNGKCPWCVTGNKLNTEMKASSRYIELDLFKQVIDYLIQIQALIPKNTSLYLFNWGEPLLHPQCTEIFNYLDKKEIFYHISTNASYLNNIINAEFRYLQKVRISMSGFSQNSYGRIHGFDFKVICDNIKQLQKLILERNTKVNFEICFHMYQFNINEISDFRKFCLENNITLLPIFAYINDYDLTLQYFKRTLSKNLQQKLYNELILGYEVEHIKNINQVYTKCHSFISENLIAENCKKLNKITSANYICPQWEDTLVIDEYANVGTCCSLPKTNEYYNLGPIFAFKSFGEIYEKRKSIAIKNVCRECINFGIAQWFNNPVIINQDFESNRWLSKLEVQSSKIKRQKQIIRQCVFNLLKDKTVVFFGSGSSVEKIYANFSMKASYFVDNNQQKWGKDFKDSKIYSPEQLLKENVEHLAIIVASQYYTEISNQLQKMGFKENIHYWNGYDIYIDEEI